MSDRFVTPAYVHEGMFVYVSQNNDGRPALLCEVKVAAGNSARVVNQLYGIDRWAAVDSLKVIVKESPEPKRPWREVVHIDIAKPGKHGAQPWLLTLSCGHLAFRSRGNTKNRLRSVFGGLRFAPKKVRCLHCGLRQ